MTEPLGWKIGRWLKRRTEGQKRLLLVLTLVVMGLLWFLELRDFWRAIF